MSASSKKKLRNAEQAAKMTEKQLVEQKEAKKLKIYSTLAVVVLIALVVFAAYVGITRAVANSGIRERNTVALTIGDKQLSNAELNYYFIESVNNFYNQYGSYASLLGLDMTKPLNENVLDEESGETWADDFLNAAIESAKSIYALTEEAKIDIQRRILTEKQLPDFGLPIQRISYMDGCKVYFEGGWIIVRFSGTEPRVRIFAEMDTHANARALVAIAHEIGMDFEIDFANPISEKTPNLCHLAPAGPTYMEDLNEAGGVHAVMNELNKRGHEAVGSDLAPNYNGIQDSSAVTEMEYISLDVTNAEAVGKVIREVSPDVVIHCAAWTAVDLAEDLDKIETVRAVNAYSTQNIASVCKELDCKMVYISTDYVFGGSGNDPWKPDCTDFNPLNVYGQTKLEGERAVASTLQKYFIVRIAWVFGTCGKNFVRTMLSIGKKYDMVRVVNDQIGTPTYTFDLARLLVDMVETDKYGYYHATNEGGYISWYDFACEIFRQAGYTTNVIPVTTEEYGQSKAARPFNSRLDKSKLTNTGFTPLPNWQDALCRYLKEIKE